MSYSTKRPPAHLAVTMLADALEPFADLLEDPQSYMESKDDKGSMGLPVCFADIAEAQRVMALVRPDEWSEDVEV